MPSKLFGNRALAPNWGGELGRNPYILEKIRLNRISVGGDGLEWVSMYFSQPEGTARVRLDPTTPFYIRIYRQKLPILVKKGAKKGICVTMLLNLW